MFKYIGKIKLLRTLKMQLNNPNIWFKDVIYTREEHFGVHKQETVVYIDNDTHYRVRHEYSKNNHKSTLYYEVIKQVSTGHFHIVQKKILEESEDKYNESCYA